MRLSPINKLYSAVPSLSTILSLLIVLLFGLLGIKVTFSSDREGKYKIIVSVDATSKVVLSTLLFLELICLG